MNSEIQMKSATALERKENSESPACVVIKLLSNSHSNYMARIAVFPARTPIVPFCTSRLTKTEEKESVNHYLGFNSKRS